MFCFIFSYFGYDRTKSVPRRNKSLNHFSHVRNKKNSQNLLQSKKNKIKKLLPKISQQANLLSSNPLQKQPISLSQKLFSTCIKLHRIYNRIQSWKHFNFFAYQIMITDLSKIEINFYKIFFLYFFKKVSKIQKSVHQCSNWIYLIPLSFTFPSKKSRDYNRWQSIILWYLFEFLIIPFHTNYSKKIIKILSFVGHLFGEKEISIIFHYILFLNSSS